MKSKEVLISRIMPLIENNYRKEIRQREILMSSRALEEVSHFYIDQYIYEKNLAEKKRRLEKLSYKTLTGLLGTLKEQHKKAAE